MANMVIGHTGTKITVHNGFDSTVTDSFTIGLVLRGMVWI